MIAILIGIFSLHIPASQPNPVRRAVASAVPQLMGGATGHADKKSCFACHNQVYPALALRAARARGLEVPQEFFESQSEHVRAFLASNRDRFLDGRGTGGQAATAALALLTLEQFGHKPDETTAAVAAYLLKFEPTRDHWRTNSNRPPTEASDFTTTYAALRALRTFGARDDRPAIEKRRTTARAWLEKAPVKDTEDRVFRLLGLKEAGSDSKTVALAAWELVKSQRGDGGWSQLDGGASDAYATGSALYALHHAGGLKADGAAYRAGVEFLLKSQLRDGTWKVQSRSKPFQPYYESGFPHEKDQFISIAASGWATAALIPAMK